MQITTSSSMAMQIGKDLAQVQNRALALDVQLSDSAAQVSGSAASEGFPDLMKMALQAVNAQDAEAGRRMADVDAGQSDDLVGAMLASQEASLSFSMLMQVRNKVVGAMDELIKLQL